LFLPFPDAFSSTSALSEPTATRWTSTNGIWIAERKTQSHFSHREMEIKLGQQLLIVNNPLKHVGLADIDEDLEANT
jgi:hypothetical protein